VPSVGVFVSCLVFVLFFHARKPKEEQV